MVFEWYHGLLATVAVLASAAGLKTPRATFWVFCLTASFVASVAYYYAPKPMWPGMWWPLHSGIAALCDAMIVVLIFFFGKEKWETLGLRGIMLVSVSVNMMQTSAYTLGYPPPVPHALYSSILEVINFLALILLGGIGLLDRYNATPRHRFSVFAGPYLGRIGNFAHQKTWKIPPLTKW
jgi:hypothetical protein